MVAVFDAGHLVVGGWLQEPVAAPGTQQNFGEASGGWGRAGCLARSLRLGAAWCFQFLTACSLFSPAPPQSSTL